MKNKHLTTSKMNCKITHMRVPADKRQFENLYNFFPRCGHILAGTFHRGSFFFQDPSSCYKNMPENEISYMLSGLPDLRFKAPVYELSALAHRLEAIASQIRNATLYSALSNALYQIKPLISNLDKLRNKWADARAQTRKEGRP